MLRVGRLGGFGAQRVDLGHLLADVLVEEGAHLAFGQRAHELVHRPAADEQHHQRDAADLQRRRDLRRLVGVELGQHEAAAVLLRQLLQDRLQVAARAAPRRPAVQQHRHVERALEHGLAEVGFGDVEGQVGGGGSWVHGVQIGSIVSDASHPSGRWPLRSAQCKESAVRPSWIH
jgi:hypothetical protein